MRGHGVVFARGLEIDLANALAARLGIPRVVFYQEPQFGRLLAPGPKPWDIALAEVTITPERAATSPSASRTSSRPGRAAPARPHGDAHDDRPARATAPLLAERHTSATLVATQVKPVKPARLFGNTTLMLDALQAGPLRRRRLRRPDPRDASARRCRGATGRSSA